MLFYDNEFNILRDVHELEKSECLIISDYENSENYIKTAEIIDDILDENGFKKWVDNSHSNKPPDLINNRDKIAIEVMRVDDHSADGKTNPNLARQRALRKEINPIVEHCHENIRVSINAVTNLPADLDHNYKYYYTSFNRVINKHLAKLEKYKSNFPDYKMCFLILDETSGVYIESIKRTGNGIYGKPHFAFLDKRFLDAFLGSELDYLIWFIPYNLLEAETQKIDLPKLIIFDIKNLEENKEFTIIEYDEIKMIKNEE